MRLLALALVALADGALAISVEVGTTIERPVANANGWFCDDPSLIDAAIVTRDDVNYWIATGKRPGRTLCRVGTDVTRASFVFDLTVRPASRRVGPDT